MHARNESAPVQFAHAQRTFSLWVAHIIVLLIVFFFFFFFFESEFLFCNFPLQNTFWDPGNPKRVSSPFIQRHFSHIFICAPHSYSYSLSDSLEPVLQKKVKNYMLKDLYNFCGAPLSLSIALQFYGKLQKEMLGFNNMFFIFKRQKANVPVYECNKTLIFALTMIRPPADNKQKQNEGIYGWWIPRPVCAATRPVSIVLYLLQGSYIVNTNNKLPH